MTPTKADSASFWEERLASRLDLRGTGHRAFSLSYNRWLYQAQLDSFDGLIRRYAVDIAGKRVLDIGSGTGFYVDYFLREGAGSVYGIDITETSVRYLQQTYSTGHFLPCDIASKSLPIRGPFDIISAISVLYHVVDDARFDQALRNICQLLEPNGYLLLSDTFARSLLPTATHARHRLLTTYTSVFAQYDVQVVDVIPMYYFLNRTFVPVIGPRILSALSLGRRLYQLDTRLRNAGLSNLDGMKLMLARRNGQF